MPIYEYECQANKHRFEKWQSVNDQPVQECPTCGSPVRKVLHPAGIIFKGSGWYITDSRKPSASETETKSEAKPAADAKPSGEAKPAAETKPAGESKPAGDAKAT